MTPVQKKGCHARLYSITTTRIQELRKKPLIGSVVLIDFVFTGDNLWKDGKNIPIQGKTARYTAEKLTTHFNMIIECEGLYRPYSFFGGSTTWKRSKA